MTTKLTLTIEDDVIDSAKAYARKRGESLSNLVETYLKSIIAPENEDAELSPRVKKLKGAIKLPEDFDYKTELGKAILSKYQ